jgi:hypothetical protein
MRLQFNKIGYEIYEKEQSRRVPAVRASRHLHCRPPADQLTGRRRVQVRAKPGNPGYGFRRAKWRNTMEGEDRQVAHLCNVCHVLWLAG